MGDGDETFLAGGFIDPREVCGRVTGFPGIQAHSVDVFLVAAGGSEGLEGFLLGEVAQEAHDQFGGDPQLIFAFFQAAQNAAEHRLESDAAIRMAMRV